MVGVAASLGQSVLIRPGTQECLVTREEGFAKQSDLPGQGHGLVALLRRKQGKVGKGELRLG